MEGISGLCVKVGHEGGEGGDAGADLQLPGDTGDGGVIGVVQLYLGVTTIIFGLDQAYLFLWGFIQCTTLSPFIIPNCIGPSN